MGASARVIENLSVLQASESDASLLTELALRSKSYWGYDPEFLEACRAELTIEPEYVASHPTFVLEDFLLTPVF
jgi:hypothetical protein